MNKLCVDFKKLFCTKMNSSFNCFFPWTFCNPFTLSWAPRELRLEQNTKKKTASDGLWHREEVLQGITGELEEGIAHPKHRTKRVLMAPTTL